MLYHHRLLILNSILSLAVAGGFWGRSLEDANVSCRTFLRSLNLPFRNWKATDGKLSESDWKLIQPDDLLLRHYESADRRQSADLAVVAGHRKQTVHTPAFCMGGEGWETIWQGASRLELDGKSVAVNQSIMSRDRKYLLLTYFFTDGANCTPSLYRFQVNQLTKRFRAAVPIGALVRVIVPTGNDEASVRAARRLTDEFAAATLPPVLNSLRNAYVAR